MVEFISFLILNIILARIFLSKKMVLAAIMHDIIFIVTGIILLFNLDSNFIKEYLISIVGESNYYLFNSSLECELGSNYLSFSSILVIEESIFTTFLILALFVFIKCIKKLISDFKITYQFKIDVKREERVHVFNKLVVTRNKLYLEKCCLRI